MTTHKPPAPTTQRLARNQSPSTNWCTPVAKSTPGAPQEINEINLLSSSSKTRSRVGAFWEEGVDIAQKMSGDASRKDVLLGASHPINFDHQRARLSPPKTFGAILPECP